MPYSTKQHQAVLRCLEARGETACTAAELAEDLRREGCPVGLATIYRQLEKLEAAGAVHKVNTEEGALYQYCGRQSQGHRDCFLLKCERCGRIRHVDCTRLQNLYDHLERGAPLPHRSPGDAVFRGVRRLRRRGGPPWSPMS